MELMGKHVKLRAQIRQDLAVHLRWLNDPELSILIQGGMAQPHSLERLTAMFEQRLKADRPAIPTELNYIIADLQDNCAIGLVGLQHIDWKNRCGSQFFFLIDPAVRSRGLMFGTFATEAVVLFLHHVFSNLGLHRIEAETLAYNHRVLRNIEKLGFRSEGVRRERVYIGGRYVDSHCYGLLKLEFSQSKLVGWVLSRLGLLQKDEPNRLKGESHVPAEIR